MKLRRRFFLQLAACVAVLFAAPHIASAQNYPSKPVRLLVGFPAGGPADIGARLVAQWLSERLGQQVIVENRAGAATNLATEVLVRAPADGYSRYEYQAGVRTGPITSASCDACGAYDDASFSLSPRIRACRLWT